MNQIGWCAGIEQAELLAAHGLDYVECALSSLQVEDERSLGERIPLYVNSPLPVRALNIFAPDGMKLVGPQVDRERIRRYVNKAGEAASRIGVEVVVLGSGKARMIPENWERQHAEDQMLELLNWIAEDWQGNGITLTLEPLNRKESNLMNSVADAVHLAKQINSPTVRVLADFYHMDEEKEPLDTILTHKDCIAHIHLADTGRHAPGTGVYPYQKLSEILQAISYTGKLSAECHWPALNGGLSDSISYLKEVISRIHKGA
ncbi:hypothetical protein GCM10008018_63120 [Paenibacillus marchantiophytorum]|uniref:Xylose isomerase-like TIM barrel domain-containing protein n=1 Tax=Paenibacillus marchantiophytorum TaxID=1619310 RepID=A0ABQ1FED8_9BACL|nr:sugar phosphate isomerase/epimerase family protein [Paenibacillus marchantiophytorum]GGA08874.1 hypothetical protein GCM10008018_63120 [Paenibacillus marchantiophytorum]